MLVRLLKEQYRPCCADRLVFVCGACGASAFRARLRDPSVSTKCLAFRAPTRPVRKDAVCCHARVLDHAEEESSSGQTERPRSLYMYFNRVSESDEHAR